MRCVAVYEDSVFSMKHYFLLLGVTDYLGEDRGTHIMECTGEHVISPSHIGLYC